MSTRQLIFIALMAALVFVVNFSVGEWLVAATGVPGGSGFVTGFTNGLFITVTALILRKFGSITLVGLIYGILALPTNMAGGPPGFIWKLPLIVLTVLLAESIIHFMSYRKSGFFIALAVGNAFSMASLAFVFWMLGMSEFEKLMGVVYVLYGMFVVLGFIGIVVGFVVYARLKSKRWVLLLQN
jgi:hypothetical protein